ncbi:MAG: PAN domain-containing protein [Vicinamibacterales bacterium]
MLKLLQISAISLMAVAAVPSALHAQMLAAEVDWVLGTVRRPSNLRAGESIAVSSEVQAGDDGLIMLSQSWRVGGETCVSATVVAYGASYTVRDDSTPGRCVATTPRIPTPGRPSIGTLRVLRAKADEVSDSDFDRWTETNRQRAPRPMRPDHMEAVVHGLAFRGGDYDSAPTRTAAECSARCSADSVCVAATFIYSQNLCWLKNTVPPSVPHSDMASVVKRR